MENIEYLNAKEKLYNHGVICFPTETVMGFGVIFDDEVAYNKLNKVKRRPEDKPYTLMLPSVNDISKYAILNEGIKKIIDAFLPGPLTLLLNVKPGSVPSWVTHDGNVIGIRVSSHKLTSDLIKTVGKPLLVPSANRSGMKPFLDSISVKNEFGNEIDYIINGESGKDLPSTIIDVTGPSFKIIRVGSITETMIQHSLK